MNEFTEIILGGTIIIPAAFTFFGPLEIQNIAKSGAFNLSFVTMPLIFQKIMMGAFFGCLWFLLLFLAGITSSVFLAQPAIAFMEDEFNITRQKAVSIFGVAAFLLCQPTVLFLAKGVVNELDFWGGTFCLVLFATVEIILFAWIFGTSTELSADGERRRTIGMDRAWEEIHRGADMRVPKIYKFIIKYITPSFLFLILGFWLYQDGIPTILMRGVPEADRPFVLATRLFLVMIFVVLSVMVHIAWRGKKGRVKA